MTPYYWEENRNHIKRLIEDGKRRSCKSRVTAEQGTGLQKHDHFNVDDKEMEIEKCFLYFLYFDSIIRGNEDNWRLYGELWKELQ